MEILAPVGNWTMLTTAVQAGADAVYFGVRGFNMRVAANNFKLEEIGKVVSYCHKHNVKAYCPVNTIIYESELDKLEKVLQELKSTNIDAVICWDLAVVKKCQELGIETHLSTQASVSNSEAALYWKKLGVTRVVLARECSLEDAKLIKKKTGLEIELFVHGARCISLSGRCFMSQELFKKSANRGECWQPCRRKWKVIDPEDGHEMIMDNNFVMSAKDLCTLPLLNKLVFADCLKIEGRNRSPDYVAKVVSIYRRAIDAIEKEEFDQELIDKLILELKQVYNKDFSRGFLVDYPHHKRCDIYGSKATTKKVQLGKVSNYYQKIGVAEFKVECGEIKRRDKLAFSGPTTGYVEQIVTEMRTDAGNKDVVKKGEIISVKVDTKVRVGDKVFLIVER